MNNTMNTFHSVSRALSTTLDTFTCAVGKSLSWLALIMVITITTVVIARKTLGLGSIAVQESIVYMHGFLVMLTSAYTLYIGGHVRVDIFYRRMSSHQKAWIDTLGSTLFLLPTALAIVFLSWDFVLDSWRNLESSTDAGGLPAVFILKSLLLANGLLLMLQAISEILKATIAITVDNTNEPSHTSISANSASVNPAPANKTVQGSEDHA